MAPVIYGYKLLTPWHEISSTLSSCIKSNKEINNQIGLLKELHQHQTNLKQNINISIDTKQTVNTNIDIKVDITKEKQTIIELLSQIESQLNKAPALKQEINRLKNDISIIEKNEKSKKRFVTFVAELGNEDSTLYNLLKGFKVANNLIKNVLDIGLFIINTLGS